MLSGRDDDCDCKVNVQSAELYRKPFYAFG